MHPKAKPVNMKSATQRPGIVTFQQHIALKNASRRNWNFFYHNHTFRVTVDSEAFGNTTRQPTAQKLSSTATKSSQSAQQADKSSPLIIVGHLPCAIRRAHVPRDTRTNTTVWPGEFVEVTLSSDMCNADAIFALEPRIDTDQ